MEIFKSMEVWFEMLAASQFFSIALDISTNKWVELLVMLISRTFIHHLHLLNYYLTFINGRVMNTTISIHIQLIPYNFMTVKLKTYTTFETNAWMHK